MKLTQKLKGELLVLIAALAWGISGSCGQFLSQNQQVDPLYISFLRLSIGGVVILGMAIAFHRKEVIAFVRDKSLYGTLLAYSVCGVIMCQVAYLEAIAYTNAGIGTMMEQFALLIILAITCWRENRKPFNKEVAAIICAIIGIVLVTTHLSPGVMNIPQEGILWGVVSACACATYILLPVRLLKNYPTLVVTGVSMVLAAIIFTPVVSPWEHHVIWDLPTIGAFVGMILGGTIIGYISFNEGVRMAGAVIAGLINSTELIWATLISAIFLGTALTGYDWIGILFIFAMTILVTLGSAQDETSDEKLNEQQLNNMQHNLRE